MKKTILFFTLLAFASLKAQIVNIPDANFKAKLLAANTTNFTAKDANANSMVIDANGDGEIQNTEAANVYGLNVSGNFISNLTGIELFTSLTFLNCEENLLTTLDVSGATSLEGLHCSSNQLTTLDVSQNTSLEGLYCSSNQLTTLDVSANASLTYLRCESNQLTTLNVSQNMSLTTLNCEENLLTTLDVSGATSLIELDCYYNELTTLDVSANASLNTLGCSSNQLTTLDVSANVSLNTLGCSSNQLTTLDVSANASLTYLGCSSNQLTTLDVSANMSLTNLLCDHNQLTTLDVSANASLTYLLCDHNQLTTLDVSGATSLEALYCSYNPLTTLDLSADTSLRFLDCNDNPNLEYINLKNGNNEHLITINHYSDFSNLPNLQSVCVDELNTALTNFISTETGHAVTYTTYCSFEPAQSNTIMGAAFFDLDNDGCDAQDIVLDNFLITGSNGVDSFSTYAQQDGSYSVFTNEGDFTTTLTPNIPSYFSVNPASYTNTFTGFDNTFTADFCITANQTVNDVNISVAPTEARPGFDTSYYVVYKNVGTTQLNGSISYTFDDTKLDFLNASETPSSQTANSLTFDYADLDPFETRIIILNFNVHEPTASQPTNIGDVLDFTAVIDPTTGDYTPVDNTFTFHQAVIGSYDPNDMTCTEGDEILLADAANYLHYVIRFQNTGTADAINVVVKNILDDKLDWSTLQLEATSHTNRVAIKNGNDVEFIFEGIHLPDSTTDEAGSHGYIAYKIKPKDNVALGDVFNNTADIFFDYNAAIVTNTASTTIVNALSVNDAQLLQFSVYPIPSKGLLNIRSKTGVKNVAIYSKLGQLVLEAANMQQVTIANLAKGLYFVKVTDENGDFGVRKIIKE